jgi:hypothetical protein
MTTSAILRLTHLIAIIPDRLDAVDEALFRFKPSPHKWSKQEILGHLIDSATNNHQRFIRVQYEDVPLISYDQNKWNDLSKYNTMSREHLIHFWTLYNQHLVELIRRIPEENLQRECNTGSGNTVTLQWLIDDYVRHLEHHLRQLVEYV